MTEIKLTGLKSGVPIGFMAALGAFRHAATIPELGQVALAWSPMGGSWCAALHVGQPVAQTELAGLFAQRVKSMGSRPEFAWSPTLKDVSSESFRRQLFSALGHGAIEWLQAFACEIPGKEGKIEPTPLDMTVARQRFLEDADWLTNNLSEPDPRLGDGPNIASFDEALFGPWKYRDNQHSLGWDPSAILMGAFTPKAPTAMSKAGVRAAVWLAMQSIPFFPCFHDGRFATTGFELEGRKQQLRWPIWESPLTLPATRILIQHAVSLEKEDLSGRGVAAVYKSSIFKPNKYLTCFQPAELTMASATARPE